MFNNISNPDVETYLFDINPLTASNDLVVSPSGELIDDPLQRLPRQIRLTVYPDGSVRASNDFNPPLINRKLTFEQRGWRRDRDNISTPTVLKGRRMAGDVFQNGTGSEQWFSSFEEAVPFIESITEDNRYVPHEVKVSPVSEQHTVRHKHFPNAERVPGDKQFVARTMSNGYELVSTFNLEPKLIHYDEYEELHDRKSREYDEKVMTKVLDGRTISSIRNIPTNPRVLQNVEAAAIRRNALAQKIKDKDELINSLVDKVNQGINDYPKRLDSIPPTRQEVYDRLNPNITTVTNSEPTPVPRPKVVRRKPTPKRVNRPFNNKPTLEDIRF